MKTAFKICGVIFPKKSSLHDSKGILLEFDFSISLRRNPLQVRVTSGQKLCSEIIRIGNFCAIFLKEIISIKQHQMSKTNFKIHMKVLSKLLLN